MIFVSIGKRLGNLRNKVMDKQELFKSLSPDQKFNLLKSHLDMLLSFTHKRMQILPSVSALSATLLVIATFNEKLLPINPLVKFLLSLLLILIPVSLFFYNEDLKMAQRNSIKSMNDYLGEDINKTIERSFFEKLSGLFPDIAIWAILFVITALLCVIWNY